VDTDFLALLVETIKTTSATKKIKNKTSRLAVRIKNIVPKYGTKILLINSIM
jgi:hypothetical protein